MVSSTSLYRPATLEELAVRLRIWQRHWRGKHSCLLVQVRKQLCIHYLLLWICSSVLADSFQGQLLPPCHPWKVRGSSGAQCFVPLAVVTTLSECPVSCNPRREFTKVLDAPESNIACIMASSIALASSCIASLIAFRHSRHRTQWSADFDMGLGPELAIKRDSLRSGERLSPVAAR